ncbi:hypothetical protein FRACA_3470001 [Frankia canadensis]|uniref:Uncharacterized protein n=1 Tax=Frankia canadensis TaxID=1836972 RepID=A0A2I2KV79_9ACTN|nr:hypothetical protein [Frankia canadensis]SNQ49565.1 hypothetical protein FRACA_3470001 [Frankia canadensis]SOU56855.1 hypothetical protein FRACA_3470001 [Frankia canadensis]
MRDEEPSEPMLPRGPTRDEQVSRDRAEAIARRLAAQEAEHAPEAASIPYPPPAAPADGVPSRGAPPAVPPS